VERDGDEGVVGGDQREIAEVAGHDRDEQAGAQQDAEGGERLGPHQPAGPVRVCPRGLRQGGDGRHQDAGGQEQDDEGGPGAHGPNLPFLPSASKMTTSSSKGFSMSASRSYGSGNRSLRLKKTMHSIL